MTRGSTAAGFDGSESPRRDVDASPTLGAEDLLGVLDRLTDGIMIVDLDGRIEYVNEPAGDMLSRSNPELLGKRVWDEFPGSIGHPFQLAAGDAVRSGCPQRLVERYEPLDRWFEARMFPHEERVVIVFRDVTEELRAEDELREYVSRISEAERIVRFGIWKWEVKSGRVRWSDELYRIYGLEPGEFGGTVDAFIGRVHPDDRERVWGNIAQSLETLEPFVFEERIIRSDGAPRVLLSQGRVIAGPDGSAQALVGVCHDVTDRARVERALGASERRMRAIIDNTPSLISVKDLDGRYLMSNAEYERVVGIPSNELVGMRCSDVFPPEIAAAQRANDRLAITEGEPVYDEAALKRDGELRTFVTVTFALPDEDGVPAEVCTIATDVTERKERESVRRERREWAERIGSGLAEGRMLVFAQPIVSMASGEPAARELLVRMRSSGERPEVLAPAAFLPAAERYGLVQSIDVWMVRQALELTSEIVTEVNVSAVTLCDPAARREIIELLAASPEAASRIVFEVTETATAEHLEAAQVFADAVTSVGCHLALDDFGVGFGSLTYLRCLPISYIKIDRSFVRGVTQSSEDRRLVQTIIGIAREFGMKTIAEGVEDAATHELLRTLGADFVQGYHLGRPAPISAPRRDRI